MFAKYFTDGTLDVDQLRENHVISTRHPVSAFLDILDYTGVLSFSALKGCVNKKTSNRKKAY